MITPSQSRPGLSSPKAILGGLTGSCLAHSRGFFTQYRAAKPRPFFYPTVGPTTQNNKKQRHATESTMKQREMPVLGDIKRNPDPIPAKLIELCKNKQQAIALCVKWSGIQDSTLCHLLNIDKGNFSRMMSGSANFPHNLENKLQDVCGNEAILEYVNWSRNKKAIPLDPSEKIAELEQQLDQLRRAG